MVLLHQMNQSIILIHQFIYDDAQVKESCAYPIKLLDTLSKNIESTKEMMENLQNLQKSLDNKP